MLCYIEAENMLDTSSTLLWKIFCESNLKTDDSQKTLYMNESHSVEHNDVDLHNSNDADNSSESHSTPITY